jgi:hypothetical protein
VGRAVLEVGGEERAALGVGRVARGVEHVWGWAVVVGRPLDKVVRDVERGWVWGRVLKVDDDDLLLWRRARRKGEAEGDEGAK